MSAEQQQFGPFYYTVNIRQSTLTTNSSMLAQLDAVATSRVRIWTQWTCGPVKMMHIIKKTSLEAFGHTKIK